MADQSKDTFSTDAAAANRARMQGGGVGQHEMDAQRDPSRFETATNPEQRSFQGDLDEATNGDRPQQADFGDASTDGDDAAADDEDAEDEPGAAAAGARRDGWGLDPNLGRDEADIHAIDGDLGAGTPANVDIHKLGQPDNPEADWGEAGDPEAVFSSNHTRRADRIEAERGQGIKTRRLNKDTISRRS